MAPGRSSELAGGESNEKRPLGCLVKNFMKKKILFFGGSAFSTIGGIQTVNRYIIRFLTNNNLLFRSLLRFDHARDIPPEYSGQVFGADGSLLYFLWKAFLFRIRSSSSYFLCDHLNYGPVAWILSRRRYTIYVHAYEVMTPIHWIRKFALKRANSIIAVSAFSAQLLQKVGVADSKVRVIHHGEDFSTLPRCETSVSTILFVGRLDRYYKGHDHLLETAAMLKRINLSFKMRFVGGGKKLNFFRDETKRLGVEDCVRFLGTISDDQLLQEFAQASIFAMPSNGEGFGLVYLQAMANGLPCICADGDAAKEVVLHEETGMVVPYANSEALADALRSLIENPELRRQYGEAGRKRYQTYFTESAFKERFLSFLEEISEI